MAERADFECAADMFQANAFIVGRCPCGCRLIKFYLVDENDVAHAMMTMTDEQVKENFSDLRRLPAFGLLPSAGQKH